MALSDSELMADNEPLYNIGAVARITGIAETTLRVWERRYGFPASARTPGGHRLYSQLEVMRLQWVKARLEEGVQISQAVQALEHLSREGGLPENGVLPASVLTATPQPPTPEQRATLENLKTQLVRALLGHDAELADRLLSEALGVYTIEQLIIEVQGPTLHDIGTAWEQGEINVATEHFATHYIRHQLLMWLRSGPPPYAVSPAVLACAPDEWHEGSLLMLGVLLRRLRWPVVYLGQAVPMPDLAKFVAELNPALVMLVSMTETSISGLRQWPQWITGEDAPQVVFGGRTFIQHPEWVADTPGIYLGTTLQAGLQALEHLMREAFPGMR